MPSEQQLCLEFTETKTIRSSYMIYSLCLSLAVCGLYLLLGMLAFFLFTAGLGWAGLVLWAINNGLDFVLPL